MRSLGLRNVVLFVCLLFLIAPGYSYRLSDALKSNLRVGDRNILRFSAQHGHLNPSRERAQLLQTSLWQQTKAMSAEEGRLRDKRNGVNSRVLYVTDYNADPSGQYDSTRALQTAINQAFNMATKHELLPGIPDLGGVEIHLEGGDYLISHPLRFPGKSGGNLVIHGGTLRATSNFPRDGYLIELWSSQSESLRANQTKSSLRERKGRSLPLSKEFVAYEDIIIRDLLLDGNFRGGGLLVVDSIRVTVENVYVAHFETDGILVEGGHENVIRDSFIGQFITAGGDPRESDFTGIGINLISNDNVVADVVIFSAAYGVSLSGVGNYITGLHAYNKATSLGGVGIYLQLPGFSQTRIVGCHLDSTGIIAEDPLQLEITNNFLSGDANILLRATKKTHSISYLTITGNMFTGSSRGVPIVALDESAGRFTSVYDTLVDQNTAYGMALKATIARATLASSYTWRLNLNERLLFRDFIQNTQYSLYINGKDFPKHVLRSVKDNTVVVDADSRVSGTVSVLVDQSSDSLVLRSGSEVPVDTGAVGSKALFF
ncbi:polygalacturonase QRT3 [Physcomitrium patens]|uniref:Pectate lyase superfamily protein domain-containing protein n=1 Tax=Physcomitrium patens TaxID=3218 RepID=A0A2K1K3Y9_PHYPA|nr:polygalacturonase QRT3-like [Physcomitrium patens]XP_024384000.1 polygalacturonase QRT3-like [Physcomitrium patens]XP_024384001.1 polygalacturonase QRT3-like [Physcomitrium patens]PNR48495.1 hypothetical protein PHYPA_012972 [Physcomitrium patens]|eukprot:XP_024383999.1 polygalacturonase QRT3-like [Physcomitrella patens]